MPGRTFPDSSQRRVEVAQHSLGFAGHHQGQDRRRSPRDCPRKPDERRTYYGIFGYDDATRQWIVNDPSGRWCGEVYGGYSFCGGDYQSGALLRYSYAAMSDELLGADGDIWISTAARSDFSQ